MKSILTIISFQWLALIGPASATVVYFNSFSSAGSVDDFTMIGEKFVTYTPPPLHNVSIQNQQLKIETTHLFPNGAGNPPVLLGSALLMRSNNDFGSNFSSVLSQNDRKVSWSFNVANQDGAFNNSFRFVLGSTLQDPTAIAAQGYYFTGGGMVGNRMVVSRFNFGTGGGQNTIIDIPNGLGTMPQMGSFQVTFDPTTLEWMLFGSMGSSFGDPSLVSTLLGSGVDSTYATRALPYFGFGGGSTGVDIFDNVSVRLIPEPSSIWLVAGASVFGFLRTRKRSC